MTSRSAEVTARFPEATALVLAGGRSSRFGGDKLRARFGDATLLEQSVRAAASVVGDVVVLGPGEVLPEAAGPVRIRVAPDRDAWAGPLVAVADALAGPVAPIVLVVAGDMPTLVPAVLNVLLHAVDRDGGRDAAALVIGGRRQPLPVALRTTKAAPVARRLVEEGERSLRALLAALTTHEVRELDWRRYDPDGMTLRDVDRPEDLA